MSPRLRMSLVIIVMDMLFSVGFLLFVSRSSLSLLLSSSFSELVPHTFYSSLAISVFLSSFQ